MRPVLMASSEIPNLFYAAYEIRCGIEARLHEYLRAAQKFAKVKTNLWEVRKLSKEVESVFDAYDKAVEIFLTHPESGEEIKFKYTPVTPALKKIGERLGDYLHRIGDERLRKSEFFHDFRCLLEQGVKGLEFATEGTLLGPLRGDKAPNRVHLSFEDGAMPEFLNKEIGGDFKMRFRFRLLKKPNPEQKNLILKPM